MLLIVNDCNELSPTTRGLRLEYQLKSGMYNVNFGFSMQRVHSENAFCEL